MNSNNYSYEVALGRVPDSSIINKFGYNPDISSANPEIVASFGGVFDPTTDIISTAQTFTIDYDETVDGLGTTGALVLLVTYLDTNYKEQLGFHTLGSTGTDTTSFTGFGINRVLVYSNGGLGKNAADITFTATTDTTIQAMIPAETSVTQQCIFHTEIGSTVLLDTLVVNALKLAGGTAPRIQVYAYSWSRVTETAYRIFEIDIDTNVENSFILTPTQPLPLLGREVLYFMAETNTNATKVNIRFSGVIQNP